MSKSQVENYWINMSIRLIEMTLQYIFIDNLKRLRKERGLSQMALSRRCDTTCNYISQIEMGRRIPSFEKIDDIAAALEIASHELFINETGEKQKEQKPKTKEYLEKMPSSVKKEIVSALTTKFRKEIDDSLDPQNY